MAASDLWNLVSPFLAAGTAVFLARRQDRERISCFVDWTYDIGDDGPFDWLYVGIHNHSSSKIAIKNIRLLDGSFPRKAIEGTAISFDDPVDLNFPYKVDPGDILKLSLDRDAVAKVVKGNGAFWSLLNPLLRRPRAVIECVTTAGTHLRSEAETALPWTERQRWARH